MAEEQPRVACLIDLRHGLSFSIGTRGNGNAVSSGVFNICSLTESFILCFSLGLKHILFLPSLLISFVNYIQISSLTPPSARIQFSLADALDLVNHTMYDSTVNFTLDTVCPWYALCSFTIHLHFHLHLALAHVYYALMITKYEMTFADLALKDIFSQEEASKPPPLNQCITNFSDVA